MYKFLKIFENLSLLDVFVINCNCDVFNKSKALIGLIKVVNGCRLLISSGVIKRNLASWRKLLHFQRHFKIAENEQIII